MHNPRGSNNRLSEDNNNRNNANRLFDSQNNNRYAWVRMVAVATAFRRAAGGADEGGVRRLWRRGRQTHARVVAASRQSHGLVS